MVTVCSSLATLYLPQLTVTLACCCVLGCLVTSVSLELHSTLKYLKKEIYLRQPDRKVPEIDGIWNLLRFPICSSLKLIKHSLLAGVTPFFIIRILAAKNISIYSPVFSILSSLHYGNACGNFNTQKWSFWEFLPIFWPLVIIIFWTLERLKSALFSLNFYFCWHFTWNYF